MKKKSIMFALLAIPAFFISCEKDALDESEKLSLSHNDLMTKVQNGRFNFQSRDDLKVTIEELKSSKNTTLYASFEKIYRSGFKSLEPVIKAENTDLIYALSQNKNYSKSSENFLSEDNEIILDPFLAALINEKNEIVVNDSLYKFTKDYGLFFTHIKDSLHLFEYVDNLNVKNFQKYVQENPCETRMESGGYTQIDDQLTRYIAPVDECYSGGSGGSYNPPAVPQLSTEEKLKEVISNLPICDGDASGNWVQNLFGTSKVCRSYFDDSHRIKTEFWDQSVGFYKSTGIQVKTQTKTLGIWWASESDEIHLGINKILLRYNFPQPQINSYTPTGLPSLTSYKAPIYIYNGRTMAREMSFGGGYYYDIALNITKAPLPFFKLDDEPILNIYIPNLPIIDDYSVNLSTSDITSESNIKALYKMGFDFLATHANSGYRKTFAVTYQKSYDNIETIYFGESFSNLNDNHLEKKFYEDAGFVITAVWGSSGGWSAPTVEPVTDYYRNYTSYELDFYGMARRGSTWRGNRMVRN